MIIGFVTLLMPAGLLLIAYLLNRFCSKDQLEGSLLVIFLLLSLPLIDVVRRIGDRESIVSVAVGSIGAWGLVKVYRHFSVARAFVTYLCPAILLVPLHFLYEPDVRGRWTNVATPMVSVPKPTEPRSPVVMVVLDELPLASLLDSALLIDAERFPNFSALASQSYWFRNASTITGSTSSALPSILTGRYPLDKNGDLIAASELSNNLFQLLATTHEVNAYEQLTSLCPRTLCRKQSGRSEDRLNYKYIKALMLTRLLPAELLDSPNEIISQICLAASGPLSQHFGSFAPWPSDDSLLSEFMASIASARADGLYFLHVTLPHQPFCRTPSGKIYRYGVSCAMGHVEVSLADLGYPRWLLQQQHLLQVAYVDKVLGDIMQQLREVELFDQSYLIVLSDHGVQIKDHDIIREVDRNSPADILSIPLFFKLPYQDEAKVDERSVEFIDIVPTLLRLLGHQVPEDLDGLDLFEPKRQRSTKRFFRIEEEETEALHFPVRLDVERSVRQNSGLYGRGKEGLFAVSGDESLLGKPLEFVPGRLSQTIIDNSLDSVDLGSDYLPAFITGRVRVEDSSGGARQAVVVLNGIARAIVPLEEPVRGWSRLLAMVPESAFRQGRNEVQVKTLQASTARDG